MKKFKFDKLREECGVFGVSEHNDATALVALGLHALNANYFKATLIPEINSKPDTNCFIEHITNNYLDMFKDENKKELNDIRGVCKFHVDEIVSETKDQKEVSNKFYIIKFFKNLLWKFRFIKRLVNK